MSLVPANVLAIKRAAKSKKALMVPTGAGATVVGIDGVLEHSPRPVKKVRALQEVIPSFGAGGQGESEAAVSVPGYVLPQTVQNTITGSDSDTDTIKPAAPAAAASSSSNAAALLAQLAMGDEEDNNDFNASPYVNHD